MLSALALAGLAVGSDDAWAQTALQSAPIQARAAAQAATQQFDIASGSLDQVLGRYAAAAGVALSANAGLTAGRQSGGLHGRYSVAQGFEQILAEHGIQAVAGHNQVWSLRRLPGGGDGVSVLTPVRITGRRDPREQVYQTPASVAVVTREDIDRLPPRNTSDVLANVAGVFTSSARTDPAVSVNIRGMQDFGRVNVMLDGTRQNFQKSGHGSNGQVYLDPALLSRVDVSKGPLSTVGGAGAIAGVVNFRTLEPGDLLTDDKDYGLRATLSTGDNAYNFVGNIAYAQRFSDGFEAIAAVSKKRIGEFDVGTKNHLGAVDESPNAAGGGTSQTGFVYLDTGHKTVSGLFKGRWKVNDELMLGLSYVGYDAKFGYTEGPNTETSNFTGYDVRTDTVKAEMAWHPKNNDWLSVDASLYYTGTKRKESRSYDNEKAGNNWNDTRANYSTAYETKTIGGTLSNTSAFEWQRWQAGWTNGGEFFYDWTDPKAVSMSPDAMATGAFNPAWYAGATPKGNRLMGSMFSELTLDYQEWLTVSAGLRYDWYRLKGEGDFFVGSVTNPPGVRPPVTRINTGFKVDRRKGMLAPRLNVAVKPWQFLQVYASYGQGFRPPAITETLFSGGHVGNMWSNYPGVALRAEEAATMEIGSNLVFEGLLASNDRLGVKVAWFDTRVKHYIVDAKVMGPVDTNGRGTVFSNAAFVNLLDPVSFKGWEISADYDAGYVFGQLAYTYVKANMGAKRYDPFPLGSWVGYPETDMGSGAGAGSLDLANLFYVGPPRHKLATSVGTRLFDQRLELGLRFRFEQQKNADTWLSTRQPALRLYDAWASLRLSKNATLLVAVENLRDTLYYEMLGTGFGVSGPGRTVIGTLSISF